MKKRMISILLVLVIGALAVSCADTADTGNTLGTNATTTAVTTVDRDTLTKPNLSEERVALLNSVWATVKDTVDEELTINNLSVGSFYVQCGNAYVCFYRGCRKDNLILSSPMETQDTVEGYEFYYSDTTKLTVFENGRSYSLQGAYSAGVLTEEELRTVWEAYKAEYPGLYDSDE
ncbi:MAG: hypothetical protein IJX76_08755 [Clostridia bacterium]|nr:hypothetical protein [Clostridia bacterium]